MRLQMLPLVSLILIFLFSACMHASDTTHNFEGKWLNDNGTVDITSCTKNKCKIYIETAVASDMCQLDGELTVLSRENAIFYPLPRKTSPFMARM